jgi:hypothetical protein
MKILVLVTAATALNDAGPGCGHAYNPYRALPDEWAAKPAKSFVGKAGSADYQIDLPGDWVVRVDGWQTPVPVADPSNPYVEVVVAPAPVASLEDALALRGSGDDVVRKDKRPDGFAVTFTDAHEQQVRAIRFVQTPSGAQLRCTAEYPHTGDIPGTRQKLEAMCDSLRLR